MKQFDSSLLHDKLKEYFGFSSFKGNQEAVIRNVLEGKDTFVLMPTGGGKSLCYQLPAMLMDGVAIVISPLIALMKNQVDAMRTFSAESGIAHFLNSSLNKTAVAQVRQDVLDGKTKLLYFAPESLTKEDNVAFLRKIKVSFYAIDEAHCISEWGHDFRPEYRRIRPIINEIGSAPLIALTATATPKVQLDIQKNLGMSDASVFKSSFNRPNLYYEIRPKHNVDHDIIRFIKQNEGKSFTVTAVPGNNYHFVRWSDGSTSATRTDTNFTQNVTFTAYFEQNEPAPSYTASASQDGNGVITFTLNAEGQTVDISMELVQTATGKSYSLGKIGSFGSGSYRFDPACPGDPGEYQVRFYDQNRRMLASVHVVY